MFLQKRIKYIKTSFAIMLIFGFFALSCNNNNKINSNTNITSGIARIQFDTTYHDFGNLIQGEKVSYTFKFKNIGNTNLIIKDAYSTCGCTVPSYSKELVAPGKGGEIEVVFDSTGKHGVQYKTVILELNTLAKEKSLAIRANVT